MKRNYFLSTVLATVFLTGAAILVIEVTATRILAPYFGNTIFTFSSVISIILAALSLGYYIGGRLADRTPSPFVFYGIIACGGFTVLLLHLMAITLLPAIAFKLSMINGPLITSLILFLVPAILLGMLSPFAIKLLHAHQSDRGVGHVAGLAFFWSTLGSIAGSLGAGFVLIPNWGTNAIVLGTGVTLILLGGTGMVAFAGQRLMTAAAVIAAATVSAMVILSISTPSDPAVAYNKHGLYEQITVQNGLYGNRPARLLLQDQNLSSGMFLDDGSMAFAYTKYFDLHRLFVPNLQRALAIGGGAYSVPKGILETTDATVDVAEIEPRLLSLAHTYFGLPRSTRLHNFVTDGRRFLYDTPSRYDLIFSDVYGAVATVPPQFTTREFFELAIAKLNDDGIFIGNYIGSLAPETRPMLISVFKTMRSVFPQVYIYATSDPDSERMQNFIFIGHKRNGPIDIARTASINFVYPMLKDSAKRTYQPDAATLETALVFTDNYAPIEHYATKLVSLNPDRLRTQ
jgi:spermidine synthase